MHWESLYACDFFSVEALSVFETVRYMVFFVIEIKSRAVEIAGIAGSRFKRHSAFTESHPQEVR
jgi:hypothetical protein